MVAPVYSVPLSAAWLLPTIAIPFLSTAVHKDTPRAIGLRLDTLPRSAVEVGIATLVGFGLVLGLSAASGHGFRLSGRFFERAATYPFWGLVQEYALQAFVFRRLLESWGRPGWAALGASALFAALHLPNPVLSIATLGGGYVWCRLYHRHPNLLTLAVSHGWLAVLIQTALPGAWHHGLRVGMGFYNWR